MENNLYSTQMQSGDSQPSNSMIKSLVVSIPPVKQSEPRAPPLPNTIPIRRFGNANAPIKESIRVINNGVRALDLLYAIICRQFREIEFIEWGHYIWHDVPQIVKREFNRLKDFLLKGYKPRVLQGRQALLETDLLQFKHNSFDIDTDTDDAISLGASTTCMSAMDKLKASELEAELAKIKENMSSVFESKISEMQETIKKQAEAQAELEGKVQAMMRQMQTNESSTSAHTPVMKPKIIPSINKSAPPAPPLPNLTFKSSSGSDRTTLMQSIRSTGGISGLKPFDGAKKQPVNADKKPLGYDYRKELADHLAKRREDIEEKENTNYKYDEPERIKRALANPIVLSMLERMPACSSPNSTFESASIDEDW